jgi:hypothetical protein
MSDMRRHNDQLAPAQGALDKRHISLTLICDIWIGGLLKLPDEHPDHAAAIRWLRDASGPGTPTLTEWNLTRALSLFAFPS